MADSLTRFFTRTQNTNDEKQRKINLLRLIVIINIVLALFGLVFAGIIGSFFKGLIATVFFIILLTTPLYFSQKGHLTTASILICTGIWLLNTFFAIFINGAIFPSFAGQFVVLITAGLLLGSRGTIIYALLTFVVNFIILYFNQNEALPAPILTVQPIVQWSWTIGIFFVIAGLLYVATSSMNNALSKAQESQQALMQTLSEATLALRSALNLRDTLDWILVLLSNLITYDSACVFIIEGDIQRAVAGRGFDDLNQVIGKTYPIDDALTQTLIMAKEPVFLNDAQNDDRFYQWAQTGYIRGWMAIPIIVRDETLGVLTIDSKTPGIYGEAEAKLALSFANQVAIAIQNTRLFAETQRRTNQLIILNEFARKMTRANSLRELCNMVAKNLYEEFGDQKVCIFTPDNDRENLVLQGVASTHRMHAQPGSYTIPIGQGIEGRVAQSQTLNLINDISQTTEDRLSSKAVIGSKLTLPLLSADNLMGVLDIECRENNAFDTDEIAMLQTLGDQLAIAIEKINLLEQIQNQALELEGEVTVRTADLLVINEQLQEEIAEREKVEQTMQFANQRLKAMQAIDRAILSAESPEAISQVALEHLTHLIPYERAVIMLFDDANQDAIVIASQSKEVSPLQVGFKTHLNNLNTFPTLKAGKPYISPDLAMVADPSPTDALLYEEGIRSYISMPLIVNDQLIGSVNIGMSEAGQLQPEQHDTIEQVSAILSVMLQQAQLREQLQHYTEHLEELVKRRTGELVGTNEALRHEIEERQLLQQQIQTSLDRRVLEVQASTEVAQQIAAATQLDDLFQRIVYLVKAGFGYYHAQVYTLENQKLWLKEGTGDAGYQMKLAKHMLLLSTTKSLVAHSARQGKPILCSNVAEEKYWLPNPLLPETKSELAVPIKLGNEVLGVLDVQSKEVDGLTREDEALLLGLCGQIAVAINNKRLEAKRDAAEQSLKAYTIELERSNRELQDFAYVASHDLQEPLRKIRAFGDRLTVKYSDALDDRGLDYLARMQNASARMQTLINDLLTFSRVTTKAQPFAPVDLNRVVEGVVSDLEIRLEQVNGRLHIDHLPTIDADHLQMRQLFQNLIGNSLKFHRPDVPPVVTITSVIINPTTPTDTEDDVDNENSHQPPQCQITFSDNGIGFDEKYIDRIFGLFQRLHGRGVYEGTGMGLAICRKIAERHNGTIEARSKEGEGTTFIITLPITQTQQDRDQGETTT